MTIRTPPAWGFDTISAAISAIGQGAPDDVWRGDANRSAIPQVRRIGLDAIGRALALGWRDFSENRTDVLMVCMIYPIVGLLFGLLAAGSGLLQLLFPLVSGFALVGPFAAVGFYEMSRRRERGLQVTWLDGIGVLRSPAIGSVALLGSAILLLLALWLVVANLIYVATMGPEPPVSLTGLVAAVVNTNAGRTLALVGIATGAGFAAATLLLTVVAFPILLDRGIGVPAALQISLRVVATNPLPMLVWAVVVAALLALGSLPALIGLAVVLPVLGHATWYLYRETVAF